MIKFDYKKANIIAALTISIITILILLFIDNSKNEQTTFLKQKAVADAKQMFADIVLTRKWNAIHGGVYIKQHGDLEPNPYLEDNHLLTQDGDLLIKVNPAWMTRQLSELYNKEKKTSFKITSLNPLNPKNLPNNFEKEALDFFEKHQEKNYYYKEKELLTSESFNLMGKLLVEESCLKCHATQGYEKGEIRGGIRVTLDTTTSKEIFEQIVTKYQLLNIFVVALALILFFIIKRFNRTIFAQEQLMIAQSRHAAMGEMISMIAHQWRQPISAISMGANNILVDIDFGEHDPKELKKTADGIINQTQYLTKTIDDFRDFFKPTKEKQLVYLSEIVNESLQIMEKSFEHNNITLKKNFKDTTKTEIYSGELLQVIINILKNAKEAFIKSEQEDKEITIIIKETKTNLYIIIRDNAGGVPDKYINKIFDPYFSTKEEKNGTGLGLYMSKTIINKHLHGNLFVKNKNSGAEFTIELPKK